MGTRKKKAEKGKTLTINLSDTSAQVAIKCSEKGWGCQRTEKTLGETKTGGEIAA